VNGDMLMKNNILILLILAALCVGCVSHENAKRLFLRDRDFDVGRTVSSVPLAPPIKIEPIDERTSLYIYEFKDTGCCWSYTVDNETKKIISWKLISNPDTCYVKFKLGG
jgi:hypothetical protein